MRGDASGGQPRPARRPPPDAPSERARRTRSHARRRTDINIEQQHPSQCFAQGVLSEQRQEQREGRARGGARVRRGAALGRGPRDGAGPGGTQGGWRDRAASSQHPWTRRGARASSGRAVSHAPSCRTSALSAPDGCVAISAAGGAGGGGHRAAWQAHRAPQNGAMPGTRSLVAWGVEADATDG